MAVKTKKPTLRDRSETLAAKARTKKTASMKSQPRGTSGQFGSATQTTARKGGTVGKTTAQMNKGKGAVGASKPPKGVNKPAGGSKPKGGKGC